MTDAEKVKRQAQALNETLDMVHRLRQALSVGDPSRSYVNHQLVQDATTLLDKYGRGGPNFTG